MAKDNVANEPEDKNIENTNKSSAEAVEENNAEAAEESNSADGFISFKEKIIDYLSNSQEENTLDSTDAFTKKTREQISARGDLYEKLLNNYVNLSQKRNDKREEKKEDFYNLIKGILISSGVCFVILLLKVISDMPEDLVTFIPIASTAFVAFLGEFISLPVIVAKYLFNTEEDKNMTEIIKHTQDFDINSQKSMGDKNEKNKD